MYYLTFMWPEVGSLLSRHNFTVKTHREAGQRWVVVCAEKT